MIPVLPISVKKIMVANTDTKSHMRRGYLVFLLVFLGMLSAFGPFVTDMYLPVLPQMADIFGCSASTAQLGLTMSLIGLAVGQLFFGPVSDKYGRKPVLTLSLVLFAASTVVILFSPTMEWFNLCRLFQGIGGAGGIVLSRSIATDYYTGRELAKTLAIIGAINGIAPVASPVVGGLVATFTGWQGIFIVLLCIGLVILAMCVPFEESHPQEKRSKESILASFGAFLKLAGRPYFCAYVLMYSFACAILFAYISSASFIIQNHYSYSPMVFSVCFAINSVFIGVGSGLSVKIRNSAKGVLIGSCILLGATLLQFVLAHTVYVFAMYEVLTIITLTGVGFVFTASTTLTMTEGRDYIGASSALFGAMGFLFGGIVSPLVGIGDIVSSTTLAMLICASLIFILGILAIRRKV